MSRSPLEVADVIRQHAGEFVAARSGKVTSAEHYALKCLATCRTAALGGHLEECDHCGHKRPAYNSCRNRHCPKCQAMARAEWLAARQQELLPVPYYHVVFTIPESIAQLALQNKKVVYNILFAASAETLQEVAADPKHLGASIGILSVLHTWGQNLQHHPHVHCVVPGGGIASDEEQWIGCKKGFFLPVKVLSRVFRAKFLTKLRLARQKGQLGFHGRLEQLKKPSMFARLISMAYQKDWVVYCKRPFGGPEQVLKYLARYTHRVAISNNRLVQLQNGRVTFHWKNYANGNRTQTMTLQAVEFIRRFLFHVLPTGFMRIRHYGFMANRHRKSKLALCRELIPSEGETADSHQDVLSTDIELPDNESEVSYCCPSCGDGKMITIWTRPRPTANQITKLPWIFDTS